MDETFINPYTFVPLPPHPPTRERPRGHLGDPDLLSGTLRITLTATAPLLIRGFPTGASDDECSRLPARPDGSRIIPGSALKGALRSLHETLTGSCLRVFDNDFVPVYRDTVSGGGLDSLRPAVVEQHESEDDTPVLRLCSREDSQPNQTHRVGHEQLEKLNDEAPLTAGDLLAVHTTDDKGRPAHVARAAETDTPENRWVLFLSDAGAREQQHPYHAHIRRLDEQKRTTTVSEQAWKNFRSALERTDDQRTAKVGARDTEQTTTPVEFTHQPKNGPKRTVRLGHRHLASKRLSPGQPVWVKMNEAETEVVELRLSMLWRHVADTANAGQRAEGFGPCQDGSALCPSCQVFGSAEDGATSSGEPNETDQEKARQHSYRGHVRFGDAHVEGAVTPMRVTLPPLGTPNPGSGQFYLVADQTHRGNAATDPPLREWGSIADAGSPRDIRGRKYYWQTPSDSGELPARAQARAHHSEEMVAQAEAFPAGTRFTAILAFTDLSRAQLGGLLSTLQPAALLGKNELHQHIGGGRPLGYGSCQISVDADRSQVWTSGARYGADGETVDLAEVSGLLNDFRQSLPPRMRETWELLATALDPNSVDPAKISYPPGAGWDQRDSQSFDTGFEFWKRTSGAELKAQDGKRAGYPLTPLPDLAEADQTLSIEEKATSKPLSNQSTLGGKRR